MNNAGSGAAVSSIDDAIGSDILQNILSRLPAKCFASAACVNRTWSSICTRILSSPKLASAISLNPSFDAAVDEVIEKVLSEPIRPQFAVAYVGPSSDLSYAHRLITERLGSRVPVVTSMNDGIIGRDALTNEFKEVQWEEDLDDDTDDFGNVLNFVDPDDFGNVLNFGNVQKSGNVLNSGILLTLGYLPGLKVNLIPLTSKSKGEHETLFIDEFVTNIREYTSSVSASASPDAIMLFSDLKTNMRPVLQKMDYAFASETIIVGDCQGRLRYRSNWVGRSKRREYIIPAVALLFVKDRDKAAGIGETKFFAALSSGMRPVGPTYKAASVKEIPNKGSTWLTARSESAYESLDGRTILDNIYNEIGDQALYVGVKKQRKCSIGKEKVRCLTFLEFHEVFGGDDQYLYVNHTGIRTGDPFQFYVSDIDAALSSCDAISETFKLLKPNDSSSDISGVASTSSSSKPVIYGGFVFACRGRGESFFDRKDVDSMLFLENFPGATLAGAICNGEIIRGKSGLPGGQEHQVQGPKNCFLHFYSTVYLLWSYIPVHRRQV